MATQPNQLDLYVDTEGGKLLKSTSSTKAAAPPSLTFGDTVPVTVQLLRKSPTGSDNPWTSIDLTSQQAKVAIGTPGGNPSAGTWAATWDSNTTINIAYNASASNVQASLNSLTTIQNAGNVTVTRPGESLYRVVWNNVGARNVISVDSAPLYPTSEAQVTNAQTGNATVRAVQLIHLETKPAAWVTLTTALPSAAATVTKTRDGNTATGTSEIQTVDLTDPEPIGGTWTATVVQANGVTNVTPPLAYNIAPSALQTALINTNYTALANKITVTGAFPFYTLEYDSALGNVGTLTTNVSSLTVPTGFKGDLDCNTAGFREILAGETSQTASLEVQISNTASGNHWTPLQVPCTLREDLLASAPASSTPLPSYIQNNAAANVTNLVAQGTHIGFYKNVGVTQPTALSNVSGGATQDTEARAVIDSLLQKLRDLGLISSI
jgi:hypothetical protein